MKVSAIIFLCWGVIVAIKGIYDSFWGEPESNLFSPNKWDFVSKHQWLTWSGFEVAFGAACICIFFLLLEYSKKLPEFIERKNEQTKAF